MKSVSFYDEKMQQKLLYIDIRGVIIGFFNRIPYLHFKYIHIFLESIYT